MAFPTLRGHQAFFKFYQDGSEVLVDTITKVAVNQDSSFSRHLYVGNPIPQGDQSFQGWTGSFDTEVRDSVIDRFIDALVTNNLNGVGVSDYTFVIRENYSDGRASAYAYVDCQFKMNRDQGGLDAKIMKSIEFQAAYRVRIT